MKDKYQNALKDSDGNVESFTLTIAGKDFFCKCGCNILHKPNMNDLTIYKCNGCGTTYKSNQK